MVERSGGLLSRIKDLEKILAEIFSLNFLFGFVLSSSLLFIPCDSYTQKAKLFPLFKTITEKLNDKFHLFVVYARHSIMCTEYEDGQAGSCTSMVNGVNPIHHKPSQKLPRQRTKELLRRFYRYAVVITHSNLRIQITCTAQNLNTIELLFSLITGHDVYSQIMHTSSQLTSMKLKR